MPSSLAARTWFLLGALALASALPARAADDDPAPPTTTAQTTPKDDGVVFRAAEPDFTLISLPTNLPLGRFKSAFRVTHRFTRPLGQGDFGDLAGDAFGLDNGAQIGLEYRFGIVPHGQIGVNRTSDRTIELFGQYELLRQNARVPVGVSALVTVDGTNNFKDRHSPGVGAIVSWMAAQHVALYAEPIWVGNANLQPGQAQNDTFMLGLGARIRVRPTVYLVAEAAPRASGYEPGVSHRSFAIEKHLGGHMFQLNFSDSFATTMGQVARGGPPEKNWYLGFNISRKFY